MSNSKEELIYKSGIKLFGKFGVKKVSIDMIVEDAGIAKGTFYLYFKNKIELYENIIDNTLSTSQSDVGSVLNKYSNPKERVICDLVGSLYFFSKNDMMRNLIYGNKDYLIGKIDIKYLMDFHSKLINENYSDISSENKEMLQKIMGFYIGLLENKKCFQTNDEFMNFALDFASIISNGIFTDYKQDTKKIDIKKMEEYIDNLNII